MGPILITVGDMDRSIDFYSQVLTFKKVSDSEAGGDDVERFFGIFGSRVRVVRMRLGDESIELVQSFSRQGAARFQWTRVATTIGFSTSPLLSATWTVHKPDFAPEQG